MAVNSSSNVSSSASLSRLESDTFRLTMSQKSGGNLANRTGERSALYDVGSIPSDYRLRT